MSDRLRTYRFAFIGKGRVASYYKQVLEPGKLGDDVLRQTVGEVELLRVVGKVVEGQDSDGGLAEPLRGLVLAHRAAAVLQAQALVAQPVLEGRIAEM